MEAGIIEFTPYDLRRSFISNLLNAGADLAVVQRLAGHADSNTTAGYDRRSEVAKQNKALVAARCGTGPKEPGDAKDLT